MTCKTRQAAESGKRKIPHYYLHALTLRRFNVANPQSGPDPHDRAAEHALQAFEARIDWSTWGASR